MCDLYIQPDEFDLNRFTLRPTLYNRQTELLIVVTLYNENEVLFCRTLHGVMSTLFSFSLSLFFSRVESLSLSLLETK